MGTNRTNKNAVVTVSTSTTATASPLMGMQVQFADKMVTMDTFVRVLAAMVGDMIRKPDTMSVNKARTVYGRAAVSRWIKSGMIVPMRTGTAKNSTMIVKTKDLELCQVQDQLRIR